MDFQTLFGKIPAGQDKVTDVSSRQRDLFIQDVDEAGASSGFIGDLTNEVDLGHEFDLAGSGLPRPRIVGVEFGGLVEPLQLLDNIGPRDEFTLAPELP